MAISLAGHVRRPLRRIHGTHDPVHQLAHAISNVVPNSLCGSHTLLSVNDPTRLLVIYGEHGGNLPFSVGKAKAETAKPANGVRAWKKRKPIWIVSCSTPPSLY
jgi:hypothetical protein